MKTLNELSPFWSEVICWPYCDIINSFILEFCFCNILFQYAKLLCLWKQSLWFWTSIVDIFCLFGHMTTIPLHVSQRWHKILFSSHDWICCFTLLSFFSHGTFIVILALHLLAPLKEFLVNGEKSNLLRQLLRTKSVALKMMNQKFFYQVGMFRKICQAFNEMSVFFPSIQSPFSGQLWM